MGDLGNGLEIRHVVARVADALDVDGLGLVVDGGGNLVGVVSVDKLGLDAQTREEDLELVVGAAVQVRRGDNVVTSVCESANGDELGSLAGRGSQGSDTTFQRSYALLKDIDSRL